MERTRTTTKIEMNQEGHAFEVALMDEGSLTIANIEIKIKDVFVILKTTYNSKENYPMYVEHEYCDYIVFNEQGLFDDEFIEFCKNL